MINLGFRLVGRAARMRETAAEILVFVWGALVLGFCLIMALFFLV
jgi:hypothetical protein